MSGKRKPDKDGDNKYKKKKVGNNKKSENNQKPEWMIKKPTKDEEGKKKIVNKKEYWWCPKHNSWTRHSPEQCKGLAYKFSYKTGKIIKKENPAEDAIIQVKSSVQDMEIETNPHPINRYTW